jgi:hypothetical protein
MATLKSMEKSPMLTNKRNQNQAQKKIRKKKNTRQGLKNRQEENTQKGRTSSK